MHPIVFKRLAARTEIRKRLVRGKNEQLSRPHQAACMRSPNFQAAAHKVEEVIVPAKRSHPNLLKKAMITGAVHNKRRIQHRKIVVRIRQHTVIGFICHASTSLKSDLSTLSVEKYSVFPPVPLYNQIVQTAIYFYCGAKKHDLNAFPLAMLSHDTGGHIGKKRRNGFAKTANCQYRQLYPGIRPAHIGRFGRAGAPSALSAGAAPTEGDLPVAIRRPARDGLYQPAAGGRSQPDRNRRLV